ncbi:ATP-binding protein [Myxococcota bacterium]|nr:ATP-binding protein [Myxococcota bacterium]
MSPGIANVGRLRDERFRFVLPGRLEYRDAARAFLAYVCEQLAKNQALPEDVGHRVISAFVEAFNNAVIHAYKGVPPGPVEVEMNVTPDRLRVTIADEGVTFVPSNVPEPDLDALPEGGLGLFIIRNFMDHVGYERIGGRNVLTMEKLLAPTGDLDERGDA